MDCEGSCWDFHAIGMFCPWQNLNPKGLAIASQWRYNDVQMGGIAMTIDFNATDMQLIEKQAAAFHTSAEEFVREMSLKAARNAEYLAMLDRSDEQFHAGKVVRKTMDELEAMAAE